MKALLVVGSLFLCACTTKPKQLSTVVTVLLDRTDSMALQPSSSILRLFHCTENKEAAFCFRLRTIEDEIHTPAVEYEIPSEAQTRQYAEQDPQYHDRLILRFYSVIRSCIDSTNRLPAQRRLYSECYAAIARELVVLSSSSYDNKILLLYTDLMENGDITAYGSGLTVDDIKKMQTAYPLPKRLTGIKIFVLYRPLSRAADKRFSKMVTVYRNLLESHGAHLIIQSENKFNL
ncbi:MAG: hypothetical protein JWN78_819 [Bacteroidota bacterium]|nr:hypothetical protein [Bacteroidota bacterium]